MRTPEFFRDKVVLLGITIDNQLIFEVHKENLCKNSSYKIYALQRLRNLFIVMIAKALASSASIGAL